MRVKLHRVCAGLVVALSAGCGGDDTPSGGSRGYDARSYELRARFDWGQKRLIASEDIALVVNAGGPSMIELDSTVSVKRVHAGERELPYTVDAEARLLRVDLASLAPGSDPLTFTVDYEAAASSSLMTSIGRDGDPVASRVVYTDSEPDRGSRWLVANHRPDDRALWKVELTVEADEDVVANGERMRDERGASGRVVGYQLADPIPTYLMAFAAGQLEHTDRAGAVPLSLWYRRGLAIDPARNLDVVADAMASFEKLIGPYPFDRYSVVLVPELGGGMENATITFNAETSGQGNVSFNLNAHELAHHWFGDWVTVETFDDVWIKEGMATLLASEADRARRDAEGKGRLFGWDFDFDPEDAIRDTTLAGLDRYTSGPYQRAAWLLTQIRSKVGDQAFWRALRTVLDEHALGSIDSESFLRSFPLDDATLARALAALDRKPVPRVAIAAAGADLTFTVDDPSAVLLVPIELTVVDGAGAAVVRSLAAGTPLTLSVPAGGYLAVDEQDVHPDWSSFEVDGDFYALVGPQMVPPPGAALAAFESRSAGQQERAYWARSLRETMPDGFAELYAAIDTRVAKRYIEIQACRRLRSDAAWSTPLAPILRAPAITSFSSGFSNCGVDFATQSFAAELGQLAGGGAAAATAARFAYLASYDYGAAASFAALSQAATGAPSMQLREVALNRLSLQAQPGNNYSAVPSEDQPVWRSFFRARLDEARTVTRFRMVWRGLLGLEDIDALPQVAVKLHQVPMSENTQQQVICQASEMAGPQSAAWESFRQQAQPWAELTAAAQAVLADPRKCPP